MGKAKAKTAKKEVSKDVTVTLTMNDKGFHINSSIETVPTIHLLSTAIQKISEDMFRADIEGKEEALNEETTEVVPEQ